MSKCAKAWIVGESAESYAALAAVGHRLAESVEAVCFGEEAADAAKTAGVDSVQAISLGDGCLMEDGIGVLVDLAAQHGPDAVLFATTRRMRLAAACLAASQGTCAVNDATSVEVADDGAVVAQHMVYGGSAQRVERVAGSMAVVLLSEGLLANEPVLEAAGEAPVQTVAAEPSASGLTLKGTSPRQVESVNLAAARAVVSIGRGIEKQEDLAMIDDLARALGAEVGCTRPIAEGLNWLSRERYIGVSGATVKPNVFVAVGLSGQVQHMVGATGATTIIAINKDKNAPIFKYADYGVVADYAAVVPQLTAAFSS